MQTATAFLLSCLLTALCGCSGHNGNAVRDYQNMAHREGWHRLPASCFLTPDGQPALQYSLLRQHPSLTLTEKRGNRQPVTLSWNNGKLAVACRNTAAIAMPSCGRMVLFTVRQDGIVRYQDKKDGIPQQNGGWMGHADCCAWKHLPHLLEPGAQAFPPPAARNKRLPPAIISSRWKNGRALWHPSSP